ncbi:membrane protein [Xenorhabdus beddingii]|uniref:Membrane protein n=1 Tax=Xenorhabdus beddingii TaxID=40578 RepID=A0A1Y2SKB7_9GAMM|nr:DUF1240 domain-containing protein [Xenorhabdus beddingii]OTA18918.1 membrane protein [Xenorhabdus beddingii]
MKNKYFKALGGLILLLIMTFMMYLVIDSFFSLIFMKEEITFSGAVIMGVMSSPLLFYSIVGSIFFFIFDRLPKFNEVIVKYLSMLMIASFIVSFPISFYVNYKLRSDGYYVCDKISWMSPTTYVKDITLCN